MYVDSKFLINTYDYGNAKTAELLPSVDLTKFQSLLLNVREIRVVILELSSVANQPIIDQSDRSVQILSFNLKSRILAY